MQPNFARCVRPTSAVLHFQSCCPTFQSCFSSSRLSVLLSEFSVLVHTPFSFFKRTVWLNRYLTLISARAVTIERWRLRALMGAHREPYRCSLRRGREPIYFDDLSTRVTGLKFWLHKNIP